MLWFAHGAMGGGGDYSMISTVKIRCAIVAVVSALAFVATPPDAHAQVAEAPATEDAAAGSDVNETVAAPALDATVEMEIRRQNDELRNELRRQYLDDRAESLTRWARTINWWLATVAVGTTLFGIVVALAGVVIALVGFFGFKEFINIKAEAREAADKANELSDKADERVKTIKEYEQQAKEETLKMKYMQTNREYMSDVSLSNSPEDGVQNKRMIEEIRRISHASSMDSGIDSAIALQNADETEKAIEAWRAIAIRSEGADNKTAARAWWSAGRIMRNQEEQMTAYNRAIRLDSEFDAAYNSRGIAQGWIKQYWAAIKDFDKAIDLNSKNVDAYSNRGNAKRHLKKYSGAIDDLDEAILLDPKHVVAYVVRGNVKSDIKQYGNAIKDYDAAIRLDPKNVRAYHYRGNAKINMKQHNEAIKDYDAVIRLDPKNAFTYTNRGGAKAELKRYESAIDDFDEAIRLYSKDFYAYFNRGNVKAELKLDGARSDLQTALKLAKKSDDEFMATKIIEAIQELDDTEQSK